VHVSDHLLLNILVGAQDPGLYRSRALQSRVQLLTGYCDGLALLYEYLVHVGGDSWRRLGFQE
jgi:hypothetical protein